MCFVFVFGHPVKYDDSDPLSLCFGGWRRTRRCLQLFVGWGICRAIVRFTWCVRLFPLLRRNSTLRTLELSGNTISAPVLKSVELECVLCQLRNAQVTEIDASGKGFDDTDATRISEALRCAILCMCRCSCMSFFSENVVGLPLKMLETALLACTLCLA